MLACACVTFHCVEVSAQVADQPYADMLAPRLQSATRNPPRFQKFDRPAPTELAALETFTLASGVGKTGFNSTNNRKKKSKSKLKSLAYAQVLGAYVTDAVVFGAPGAPPVQIGPIRKKPKAHGEPDDPYAPLGIHVGSFNLFPAVELIGGYDSNPGHEPGGPAAALFTVAPELRAQSNWSRHELKVDLKRIVTGGGDVASTILSYAADSGATFMVMGGYGHSRLREFILGGATRGILSAMTVPTLMSH